MNKTLEDRGHEYGRAWYLESIVKNLLNDYHTNERELRIFYSDYIAIWDAIMAKLMRLAESPEHVDSWRDIEGYARLARRHIEDGVWHYVPTACGQELHTGRVSDIQDTYGKTFPYSTAGPKVKVASDGDHTICGMATEDVKAGELVTIATHTEVIE